MALQEQMNEGDHRRGSTLNDSDFSISGASAGAIGSR
jgi:hypothetical protein